MEDYRKSKADFVYDILCDKVQEEEIVKGMMYWYFMKGRCIECLQDDMMFRANGFYKVEDIRKIMTTVRKVCEEFAGIENEQV